MEIPPSTSPRSVIVRSISEKYKWASIVPQTEDLWCDRQDRKDDEEVFVGELWLRAPQKAFVDMAW